MLGAIGRGLLDWLERADFFDVMFTLVIIFFVVGFPTLIYKSVQYDNHKKIVFSQYCTEQGHQGTIEIDQTRFCLDQEGRLLVISEEMSDKLKQKSKDL